jgi:predicted DNA-binding ribbon-helix-helix protein
MPDRPTHSTFSPPKAAIGGSSQRPPRATNCNYLKSRVLKRSIVVGDHKTSVSLEDVFWDELRKIAMEQGVRLSSLVSRIDAERQHVNLSSALRLFVFEQSCRRIARTPPRTQY